MIDILWVLGGLVVTACEAIALLVWTRAELSSPAAASPWAPPAPGPPPDASDQPRDHR